MSYDEFFVPIDKHEKACSVNLWTGFGLGFLVAFVLCLIVGYFLP